MRKIKLADGTVHEVSKTFPLPEGAVEMADGAEGTEDIAAMVSKAVEAGLKPIKEQLRQKATSNMDGAPMGGARAGEGSSFEVGKEVADGKGIHLARYLKAVGTAKMVGKRPEEVAKSWGYTRVEKALGQTVYADGGVMVPDEFVAELIPYLRKYNVIRAAGVREIPFSGSLTMPKQTGTGTASWGAEGDAITPSQQTLGSVQFQERELRAMTVVANQLIQNATISAEEFVRDDLAATIAQAEEAAFLRGTGAASAPRGIRYWLHSDHVYAVTASSAIAPTLAELKRERAKARRKLKDASIPMLNMGWVMAPISEEYLASMTETTGATAFPEIESGKWGTTQNLVTQHVPDNLSGGSGRSELYLVDFSQCLIGRGQGGKGLILDVFPNGHYEEGGSAKSGIARNQTVVRALSYLDFIMRYEKAGVCVTGVAMGQAS